jgi:hypothetical protein
MSKTVVQKTAGAQPGNKRKKRPATNWRQILIIGALLIAAASMILPGIISNFSNFVSDSSPAPAPSTGTTNATNSTPANMPEPKFSKEGSLSFLSVQTGQPIVTIDIEKADNDLERGFGLMFRRSMAENQGMLFLFDQPDIQNFWMKNTLIPLDILYVDEAQKIITIHENTKPLSEAQIPSGGPAKYVVEVIGGFCKKHGVKVGDSIEWQ